MEDNVKDDDNNDKGISALGLDRDLGFSRGHQGHRPHDDDDNEEEDDEVDNNDKDHNNNKDDNNDEGISALELYRDQGFSRGHQGHRLMMMKTMMRRTTTRTMTTTRMTTMTRVSNRVANSNSVETNSESKSRQFRLSTFAFRFQLGFG